ncbi:MAG: MBL fold metallo-hydrolase [Acidobacteria bacterium]|nr:MBL fold metallo-hydrolase [Acidobacteriota bacterium]
MRINVLGSSSSGNATLAVSGSTRVLIDAGFSAREIRRRLESIGEDISRINAIVVTHEHSDHIRGVPVLARSLRIPVFISPATLNTWNLGKTTDALKADQTISAEEDFEIGELQFRPFRVPHDAAETLAFRIEARGVRVAYATDLGYIPQLVAQHLRGVDVLVLEANHDLEMLKNGPYPWSLKQRVMSRHGHLSNDEMARFFQEDFDGSAEHIVLMHLSRTNNHPEVARMVALQAMDGRGSTFTRNLEQRLKLARHDQPSEWMDV